MEVKARGGVGSWDHTTASTKFFLCHQTRGTGKPFSLIQPPSRVYCPIRFQASGGMAGFHGINSEGMYLFMEKHIIGKGSLV